MKLHEALKLIVGTEGLSVLSEKRLLNILNDLQAFSEIPGSKFIISSMINEGLIKDMANIGEHGIEAQKLLNDFNNKTGFNQSHTQRIFNCFEYAMGWVDQVSSIQLDTDHSSMQLRHQFIDDTPQETYEKSSILLKKLYLFLDKLSNDPDIVKHFNNLDGVRVSYTDGRKMVGDADTNTFRGRLFFCALMDLYRTLDDLGLGSQFLSPPNYLLAQLVTKTYAHMELPYSMIYDIDGVYKSFYTMILPVYSGLASVEHYFLIAHLLSDYEKNTELYLDYLSLMGQHLQIIGCSLTGNMLLRQRIDKFINDLNQKGISIKYGNV